MPPSDDPTDPIEAAPGARRARVSGAQLLDAIEALPGRIASRVGSNGASSDDGDDDSPLPPEVTFEPEPEPEPPEDNGTAPTPEAAPVAGPPAVRRGGFPTRRRRR